MNMKNFFWNIFRKFFTSEIKAHVASFTMTHYSEVKVLKDRKKTLVNYPINTKLIVRSNEPDELVIGHVVSHDDFGKENGPIFLIIKDEKTGREGVSFNTEPPYWTQEREDALRKLNWAEQWNVLSKFYDIDSEHQAAKESPEYLNRNA
jgi:hypothetical protein